MLQFHSKTLILAERCWHFDEKVMIFHYVFTKSSNFTRCFWRSCYRMHVFYNTKFCFLQLYEVFLKVIFQNACVLQYKMGFGGSWRQSDARSRSRSLLRLKSSDFSWEVLQFHSKTSIIAERCWHFDEQNLKSSDSSWEVLHFFSKHWF